MELLVSLWFRRSYESERQRVTNVGTGTLENAASLFLELLNRVLLPRRRSGNRLRGDVGIASRCAGRRQIAGVDAIRGAPGSDSSGGRLRRRRGLGLLAGRRRSVRWRRRRQRHLGLGFSLLGFLLLGPCAARARLRWAARGRGRSWCWRLGTERRRPALLDRTRITTHRSQIGSHGCGFPSAGGIMFPHEARTGRPGFARATMASAAGVAENLCGRLAGVEVRLGAD